MRLPFWKVGMIVGSLGVTVLIILWFMIIRLGFWQDVRTVGSFCDRNDDGRCDTADSDYIRDALGSCRGDANWKGLADMDNDGCITTNDISVLEELTKQEN